MNEPHKTAMVLSVHAYPDPAIGSRRTSELARHLVERGWEVHIITQAGPFPHSGGTLAPGVQRHSIEPPAAFSQVIMRKLFAHRRLTLAPNGPATLAAPAPSQAPQAPAMGSGKLYAWARFHYFRITLCIDSYKRWSIRAARKLASLARQRQSAAIFVSGPPFSALAPAALVARMRRTPLIIDLRDPWVNRNPGLTSREYRGFRRNVDVILEHLCVALSRHVVTTSQRLAEKLRKQYPRHASKIVTIRNGYDENMLMPAPLPSGQLIMLYAGTIYLNRNPLPFFQALLDLRSRGAIDPGRIQVDFVGDCRYWQDIDLQSWLEERDLHRIVSLRDPVPSAAILELTRRANVLINFAQNQKDSVPAKLFEQIASRRQVLLFTEADSESALVAGQCPQVLRVDADTAQIENAISRLYAQWVQGSSASPVDEDYVASLGRRRANEQLERLMLR
jgi:glycosyltransferase involved in cell wall biosynthesis